MPRGFRLKPILLALAGALLCSLSTGCASPAVAGITLGDWIVLLDEQAGIQQYDATKPYFVNVREGSPYYDAVQAAVEWKVLDTNTAFDPYAQLTREWAAYTLMNLTERDLTQAPQNEIRDISHTRFPKQVSAAVSSGLMTLDKHDRFCPTKELPKDEAITYLELTVDLINHKTFEPSFGSLEWNKDVEFSDEDPVEVDPEEGTAVFSKEAAIQPGQYVVSNSPKDSGTLYQIESVTPKADATEAILKPAEPETVISSIDAADSFSIDFNQATIIDEMDGSILQEGAETSYVNPTGIQMMDQRVKTFTKSHTIKGYTVTYSVTATGFKAEVKKETPVGLNVYGNLAVSAVKPTYRWKMKNGTIEDGYFTMDFMTTESLGCRIGSYKNLYGDFSRIDPNDFLGTVRNLFQKKQDVAEMELPLATIRIPVPSAPVLSMILQLQLRLYSSGKAELALTQKEKAGMEIRDGKMRVIGDFDAKADATIRASTSLMGGIRMAMALSGMKLADITTEAGAKALVASTVHLYDAKGTHRTMSATDVPSDMVDDLSDGNGNILTCADIKAYKVADIQLNSGNTMAGKLGFSKTITLLNEHNGKLIPGMSTHMENGHFVDHCTRGDRLKPDQSSLLVEADQIRIKDYSLIADPGETRELVVKAIPKGYSLDDLEVTSEKPEIASAAGTTITAHREGSTIIHLRTSDGKYEVSCTMLVRSQK